jgi:hypothetical protein
MGQLHGLHGPDYWAYVQHPPDGEDGGSTTEGGRLFPSNHSEALGPPWGCCWQLVRGSSRFGHTSDWFGLALIDLVE